MSLTLCTRLLVGLGMAFIAVDSSVAEVPIAPGAEVEKLAGGFAFTEGPARDSEGNIYFTDIPNARIHKWSVDGRLSVYREDSGGANGLYFDADGNLIVCEMHGRRVVSIAPDGSLTVLADSYDGKRLNSPNDLWVDHQGGVYFTDPRYGEAGPIEQDGFHVYYIPPSRDRVVRVIDDLVKPNGVLGTPDGQHLYVADAGDGKTYRYRIGEDGNLTDRELAAPVGADGLTLDERGNLYLARNVVHVYSPAGEKLGEIEVPEAPSNLRFGGRDGKTLFITARTGLYAIRMAVTGP